MRTPLYDAHVELGARMAPFAGWDMPIQYEGIVTEHLYTRTTASIFDTCHMGEFELRGPNAQADLEQLVTQRVSSLRKGQCRYGYLLREDGGVLDDLTVFRRDEDHFFLVVNAGTRIGDAGWIRDHLSADTQFNDLSPQRAKLDVQGPQSRQHMEEALEHPLPDLKFFRFVETTIAGIPCTLSRTGYTGEWGYELFFPIEAAASLWRRFTQRGAIRPAGLGARDTLRLEVGYPLYGHELSASLSPVPAANGQFIDLTKDFIGKPAVVRDLEQGVPRVLVGLRLESRRAARQGDAVFDGDAEVGVVTSGSLAPSLGVAVALAYVDRERGDPGRRLAVRVRNTRLPADVVECPFYRDGTARQPG